MTWVEIFIASVVMCFPYYIVGAVIVGVLWYFTRRWPAFPKILIRSLFLALLLAPGVVVGHGIFPVPAVLAVFANRGDEHHADMSLDSSIPILVVWIASAIILSVIAQFTRKRT